MRAYLKLTRAHTVPLEAVPALVGALLATREPTLGVLLWTLYGIGYHLTGYGMNSYTDWRNGYDKEDEHKQHHPLNSGELSKRQAKMMVGATGLATVILAVVLGIRTFALPVILVGVIAGVLYNEVGKETLLKPVLISIAHSTVFLAPYLGLRGDSILIAAGGTLMVFLWVMFQIAVSGELKDMDSDEANILKDMFNCGHGELNGRPVNYISPDAEMFSMSLRFCMALIFTMVAYLLSGGVYGGITLVVGAITVARTSQMMEEAHQEYSRGRVIQLMSQIEMLTLLMFLIAFAGILEGAAFIIFLASGLWVISLNKSLWGTYLAPRV